MLARAHSKHHPSQAFTLIEVVIALAVFATMTSMLISIGNSLNILGAVRAWQISAWVADNHVEYAKIDGVNKNLIYTSTIFGTEYVSRLEPLLKPYHEKFGKEEVLGRNLLATSAPKCRQVHVSVYRDYAQEPEFKMLACIYTRQKPSDEKS